MPGSFVTEDLDTMFEDDEFATEGTVGTSVLPVIFDRSHIEALGMVSGANPVGLIKASDAAVAAVGSTLVLAGTSSTIRDPQPQDDGRTVLLQLEAA